MSGLVGTTEIRREEKQSEKKMEAGYAVIERGGSKQREHYEEGIAKGRKEGKKKGGRRRRRRRRRRGKPRRERTKEEVPVTNCGLIVR